MKIDIISLFPQMFGEVLGTSILGRAQKKGLVEIKIHNLRDWAIDKRGTVDDKPFGGGVGMVLRPEPVWEALNEVRGQDKDYRTILLTASGERLKQKKVEELAKVKRMILVCGHYEGFDERVRKYFDEEISIGDYVLTGGEIASMVVADAVVRLIPGVLGKEESAKEESWSEFEVGGKKKRLLEYPQYTQPRVWGGQEVPEILLSGDHEKIREWRMKEAKEKTKRGAY
jgi:tRNA (guanine37-N1)-methyltransferase